MSDKVKEPQALNQVKEFHETFDLPVREDPSLGTEEDGRLRVSLIQEELDELRDALQIGDLVGVADALGDLQYVLSGAVLTFGMQDKFEDIVSEIHRSNMSKLCSRMEEAEETVRAQKEPVSEFTILPVGDKYMVKRKDGKLIKSVTYSEADLVSVFTRV